MKALATALLYTGLALVANPTAADVTLAASLREGDMKKLVFHEAPKPAGTAAFQTFDGEPISLSDYAGKTVVVNFWATWCAPCRHEMPMLSALQAELGGEDFEVVTIATGRNPPPAMQAFFEETGIDNLPLHRAPQQALAREMAVLGLPIPVILNPDGEEIASLRGDADWPSESAKAILRALMPNS